jgi:hypothetical protein
MKHGVPLIYLTSACTLEVKKTHCYLIPTFQLTLLRRSSEMSESTYMELPDRFKPILLIGLLPEDS